MNILKIFIGIVFLSNLAVAEAQNRTLKMYTVRQRTLCLTSEMNKSSFHGNEVTGTFEVDEQTLFKIFDSLRDHLYGELNLARCNDRDYDLDNVVFGFYDYYLQIIPFKSGTSRMVYINAYRAHCDIQSHGDEAFPRKEVVWVFDGGSSYWQIIYNLDTGEFSKIDINGVA